MEDMKVTASGYDFKPAHAAMQRLVDGNILSGVSSAVLVGRDLVDVNCAGWADKEARTPLRTDHIFRVFSNTKLITSCAALLLFEQGRLHLDDPIEKFVPQLANRKVLRPGATRPSGAPPSGARPAEHGQAQHGQAQHGGQAEFVAPQSLGPGHSAPMDDEELVGQTGTRPVAGSSVYSDYIAEQVSREDARKESLERRGLAVVTSAGAFVALLFGLAAFNVREKHFVLPHSANVC